MRREIKITVNTDPDAVEPCPHCGSRGVFTIQSEQVADDHCHVWAVCGHCGHDPTGEEDRIKDVWGDVRELAAVLSWNDTIKGET